MITFKQFLFEYKLNTTIARDTDDFLIVDAKIDLDGKIVKARFQAFNDDPDENIWMISFVSQHNGLPSSGRTDSGAQFAMKDFVVSCVRNLIAKHEPDGLTFSADKDPDDFGDTRASVYEKVMARYFKEYKREPLKQNGKEEYFLYTLKENLLNEIADYKRDFEITRQTTRSFQTRKEIGGRNIRFTAGLMNPDSGHWNIEFEEERPNGTHTYRKTGSGKEFDVAGFVFSSIIEFVARYNPENISFSAEKDLGEDDSRANVYDRLLQRMTRGPLKAYKLQRHTKPDHDVFVLKRS